MLNILRLLGFLALALLFVNPPAHGQTDAEGILASINALPLKQRTEALIAEARKEAAIEWYGSLLVPEASQIIEKFRQRYPFVELRSSKSSDSDTRSSKSSIPAPVGHRLSIDFLPNRRQVLTEPTSSVPVAISILH